MVFTRLSADQNGLHFGRSRTFDGNGLRSIAKREVSDTGKGYGERSHGHRARARSSSASSSASSSSASSTESDSSVGSLQEHDELGDQQLSVAKLSLSEWAHHPEQPITKEYVQQLRRDIKYPRDLPPERYDLDIVILRKEVRELLKAFKEAKKAQRRQRRQARRERRANKKAQRVERRAAKKEAHRVKKEIRNCYRRDGPRRTPLVGPRPAVEILPPALPARPVPAPMGIPGYPFPTRAASVPFLSGHQLSNGGSGGYPRWPYAQGIPFASSNISVPHLGAFPEPNLDSSGHLHTQAKEMEELALLKDERAIELRARATSQSVLQNDRSKMLDEAMAWEEEASTYRREATRLRNEALHLDGILARELEGEMTDSRESTRY